MSRRKVIPIDAKSYLNRDEVEYTWFWFTDGGVPKRVAPFQRRST